MPIKDSYLPFIKQYIEEDPAKAARRLENMPEEKAAVILTTIPALTASDVFSRLQSSTAVKLLKHIPHERFGEIFQKLDPQLGSSLFLSFSAEDREHFLTVLPEKIKEQIQELLSYPEGSVGRLMNPDYVAFRHDVKVRDAIQKIRALAKKESPLFYAYVIDEQGVLIGIMNMRDLMLATQETTLENVMRREVFSFNAFTDREPAAQEISKRKYFAAPVVDAQNRLLGVIRSDRLIQGVQEEATEDLQKMFGAGGDERAFSSFGYTLKKRLPWLHVNLATAFLAASVVALFEGIIAKITILAVYLPVVAGQGGNAGAQSLAVVMRGLVMREIPPNRVKNLLLKETGVGAVNGLIIGIVTAIVAWLWQGNPYMGLVIGLGMLVNLAIAGFAGAAIPLTMKRLGMDPAQCSNIILTTVTDVMGFFSFLGFAVIFQRFLI